jgi:hypothetical protein
MAPTLRTHSGGSQAVPGSLDRPGHPHAPDGPDRRLPPERLAEPGSADRLPSSPESGRWSRDELRQRLERLPPGHPSSLRGDDPDPDDWADLDDQGDRSDHQPDAPESAYWREVPRFEQAWEDHVRRWPDEKVAAAVDRSRDPEGSWRGDGNQYLDPEQHAQAKAEIARVQRTEEALTKHMTETERETGSGWLEGLDHRRKGDERIKEKAAEILKRVPDRTVEGVVQTLPDAIRYTFCFESEDYAVGYWDVKQKMEDRGHNMIYSKNHWDDNPEYKGINTRWTTPEGQRFELQFHTPESLHAKQEVTHGCYERLRNPLTQAEERRELRSFQREVSGWITIPEGTTLIPDHHPKGHS